MSLHDLIDFRGEIHVADIGAAFMGEKPPYMPLLEQGIARLSAFDGDERQRDAMIRYYGPKTEVHSAIVADGEDHVLHLAPPVSGMASIKAPCARNLNFFNFFGRFATPEGKIPVSTKKLQDVEGLAPIDYLKMDVQGAELMVLQNAGHILERCVFIQLEVSFITLYEDQPTFGDIDVWMRSQGYQPHCLTAVKRWSIAPTTVNNNEKSAFNQLLEADIVYVKGLISFDGLSDDQVRKIALIASNCYRSPDLCLHAVRELAQRGLFPIERMQDVIPFALPPQPAG